MRGVQDPEWVRPDDPNAVHVAESEAIIICDGSNSGEVFSGFSGALSSTMAKIEPKVLIDQIYLRRFLESNAKLFAGSKTGSAIPHLDQEAMFKLQIPMPPLPEQRRLARLLDESLNGIAVAKANAEKNVLNAHALFESHLQTYFTVGGPGWVERQLGSLCQELTVGHVGPMKTEYKETGVPFLRSQNIRPFSVVMENIMFIDDQFHRVLKKSQLRPGDLAIVRTGYPGTAAVIPPELPDSNCSDLVIVRPNVEVSPHFLAAFFNSEFGKQLVLGRIVGAAQKHFNVSAAKEVMLLVPPRAEQDQIVLKLDRLRGYTQHLAHIYEREHSSLDALKNSFLNKAFSGALEVAS
jgi:type I restriction enzyme S subunit